MRRRTQYSPTLGNVAVTPAENKSGFETKREYFARLEREERERQQRAENQALAPARTAAAEVTRNLATLNKHIAAAWSQPIPEIVAALQRKDAAAEDTLLPVEKGVCTREAAQITSQKWFAGFGQSPYSLTETGQQRLTLYILFAIASGYKMDSLAAIQSAFDRLRELNAFAADEITFDQSKVPAVEPAVEPTLSEHDQLTKDMWNQMYPLAKEWAQSSLRERFGYEITKADRELIFGTDAKSAYPEKRGLFYVLNLNPLDRRSYDKIRRYLCDRGYWNSDQLLDEDEKFSRVIEAETSPLSRLTGENRQTLVSSLNLLRR